MKLRCIATIPHRRSSPQWQQMGIEYTFWKMLHLCTSPKVVMRSDYNVDDINEFNVVHLIYCILHTI
ncbi:hypothetical protein ACS0TY_033556 [Phlomoides rotata]